MIFYATVILPFSMFAAMMGIDFSKVILAHRQLGIATDAAANAGAWAFTPKTNGNPGLNWGSPSDPKANTVYGQAYLTYCLALATEATAVVLPNGGVRPTKEQCDTMLTNYSDPKYGSPTVTQGKTGPISDGGSWTVTVSSEGKVTGLIFLGFLYGLLRPSETTTMTSVNVGASSTAIVCSGNSNDLDCQRPK